MLENYIFECFWSLLIKSLRSIAKNFQNKAGTGFGQVFKIGNLVRTFYGQHAAISTYERMGTGTERRLSR